MKEKRFSSKFNMIDSIVALMLVTAAVITVYFFIHKEGIFTKKTYDIEYTIIVDSISSDLTKNLAAGDVLYNQSTAFEIGKVKNISYSNIDNFNSEMTITVAAKAEQHNNKFSVGGVTVSSGEYISFRNPKLMGTGCCIQVTVIPEGDS